MPCFPPQPLFDWVELERWGADPERLPKSVVFLNRPHTLWTENRTTVVAASSAMLLLSALQLRPDRASSGAEAKEQVTPADLAGESCLLVLTDWNMPGMKGAELCQRWRQLPLRPKPLCVLVSGTLDNPGDAASETGFSAFLPKSVLPATLAKALARTWVEEVGATVEVAVRSLDAVDRASREAYDHDPHGHPDAEHGRARSGAPQAPPSRAWLPCSRQLRRHFPGQGPGLARAVDDFAFVQARQIVEALLA